MPSPNNFAEVGEASLENPLPWDTIRPARYEKLNFIQPMLPELQRRSSARIDKDQDFIYLQEDIAQYRKLLADKSVSLNEEQRLKEKQENEAKQKAREADLKSRPDSGEETYEITLKQTELPGLPPPVSKTNELASATAPHGPGGISFSGDDVNAAGAVELPKSPDDEDSAEAKPPAVDAGLKESKRILTDLISAWPRDRKSVV